VLDVIDLLLLLLFFALLKNNDDAVNKFYVCDISQRIARYYEALFYMRRQHAHFSV
jgi:hypothetical protein